MDTFLTVIDFIIRVSIDIIIIGGAFAIILLVIFLIKLIHIFSKLSEIVEDLHETYFKFHYFVSLPFRYLTKILKFKNK